MTREYYILSETTPGKLEALVKTYLKQGFVLTGGVAASGKKLYQAIKK